MFTVVPQSFTLTELKDQLEGTTNNVDSNTQVGIDPD